MPTDFSSFLQQIMGQMQPYMQQFQKYNYQGGMPWGGRGSFIDGLMEHRPGMDDYRPGGRPQIGGPLPPHQPNGHGPAWDKGGAPQISNPLPPYDGGFMTLPYMPAGPTYPPVQPGGNLPPGTYQPAPMPNPVVPGSYSAMPMGRMPSSPSSLPLGGASVSSTPSFTPGSPPAGQSPAAPAPYTGSYSTLPMGRTPGPSAPRTPGTGTTATPSFSTAGSASTIPLGRTPGPSAPRTPGMPTDSTFKI